MFPINPRLHGAALLVWVIGFSALVVGLILWLFAYDQHRMLFLPLISVGVGFPAWARSLHRRSVA